MAELMTPERLSQILGMSPHSLAVWRMKGAGPRYIKCGKHVRYREADVEQWLRDNEVESVSV